MSDYPNKELETFFNNDVATQDPALFTSITDELGRQQSEI